MVNGYDQIYVEKQGELVRFPKAFSSQEKLEDVIQQIVAKVNRRVNEANPMADARLEDGSRVNIISSSNRAQWSDSYDQAICKASS